MENPLPEVPVLQHRLSNGLIVSLFEEHSVPLVAVDLNYGVGSKNERPGHTGFAHLFEHLMFQGSKHHDEDFFRPLQEVGGSVNGATDTDRTHYWEMVPAGYLERALWLEADRMGFLLDAITQDRLDKQRSVVLNERRQNYDDRPYGTVWEQIMSVLYPPNHPLNWPTIGSIADIQAATLDDVRDFFRAYYTPNNASLAIVGDFDPKVAMGLIEEHFGALLPGPPVSRLARWIPALTGEVWLAIEDRVQLPRTYYAWPTVSLYSRDDAALDVFAQILGGGKTSRLYNRLVYELQIAQDAVMTHDSSQIAGCFRLLLMPRPGHMPEEVREAAMEVLHEALEKGITKEELERQKTSTTADSVRGMQNIGGFGGLSDRINAYQHYLGRPDAFRWDLQRYLDLTPGRVRSAVRRLLGDRRVMATVTPMPETAASSSSAATSVDRSVVPGRGGDFAFHLPARQRFTLANGLRVLLVEFHRVPMIEFTLIMLGGTAADPADLPGLASLTAEVIQEGAGGRTAKQMADAMKGLGAQFDVSAGTDGTFVTLSTLKQQAKEALALATDVVARPDFLPAELDRQKKRRLVLLNQLQDQPQYLAQVAAQRVLFGDHPYGRPGLGTHQSFDAIGLEDVRGFWNRILVPSNTVLMVVGDVSRPELETLLNGSFGSWRGGPAPTMDMTSAIQHSGRTIYLVDKPGAAQSVIIAGLVGAARKTADHPVIELLNTAFGGQFVSRLNLNLREDKGYSYGARSRFSYGAASGAFLATAPVQTAVTGDALREMLKELEEIAGVRPLTDEERRYAVGSIVNGYARRFETAGQIAHELMDTCLYGLADDEIEAFPRLIETVSGPDLERVARTYILPDKLAFVIVGDNCVVLPQVRKLGIGPIVELNREGNPVVEDRVDKVEKIGP